MPGTHKQGVPWPLGLWQKSGALPNPSPGEEAQLLSLSQASNPSLGDTAEAADGMRPRDHLP